MSTTDPDQIQNQFQLGIEHYQKGEVQAASVCFQAVLQEEPHHVHAHYNLGIIYQNQGNWIKALQHYQQAIQVKPDYTAAYNNLGNLYLEQEQFQAAIDCFLKAIQFEADYAPAYNNLGNVYKEQGQFQAAIDCFLKAIQLQPEYTSAYSNLGNVYKEQGQLEAAIDCFDKAIKLQPDYADAHYNRGHALLLLGELQSGFLEYEWRFETQIISRFKPKTTMWDGSEIEGKSIVLWNEQGLGDEIQFVRYAQQLQKQGGLVTLCTHPALVSLFRECLAGEVEVIEKNNCDIYAYDCQASMMSLPGIFQTNLDTIPNSVPYIFTPDSLRSDCVIPSSSGYRIGIVWAGQIKNPDYLKKSCSPDWFIDLLDVGDVTLYSLQVGVDAVKIQPWLDQEDAQTRRKGDALRDLSQDQSIWFEPPEFIRREEENSTLLESPGFRDGMSPRHRVTASPRPLQDRRVWDLSHLIRDFVDTVCLIEQLDLVITIDTAVAHLAGAMGKPVWVLLPFIPDWRWQLHCQVSPWYPTMRLFRQPSLGDWGSVFQQVKEKLAEVLKGQSPIFAVEAVKAFSGTIQTKGKAFKQIDTNKIAMSKAEGKKSKKKSNSHSRNSAGQRERGDAIAPPQINPTKIQQQIRLGIQYHQSGQLQAAEACYQQVLQWQPNDADAWHLLGVIAYQQQEYLTAIELIQRAIKQKSGNAGFYNHLGLAFQGQGNLAAAVQSYQRALQLNPNASEVHLNLGNVWQEQGHLAAAIDSYQQAINLNPNLPEAHNNLGNVLKAQRKLEAAIASYQRALELKPDYTNAHYNLGLALQDKGELEAAIASYQRALEFKPDSAHVHYNLGLALQDQGKLEAAIESYQRALQFKPDYAHAKFGICMSQLPIIYTNFDEINLRRERYQQHLESLARFYQTASQKERENAADAVGSLQPYFLAYQGLNDRDLQQIYGQMICQLMSSRYPQWSQSLPLPALATPTHEKVRVGFVSGCFYRHSVWKIPLKGWVENLDRNRFELFGYHTGWKQDEETARAAQFFDKFIQENLSVDKWCERIAQDKLHVLIFPELGMEPITLKLGCLRLAPIQATSWGHPETSGMPTIDYHLSSDLMEPENGQEHYSEKLVRLPNLAIHYTPLEMPLKAIGKADIGLKNDDIMFWCCQTLQKYLPQHDDVFPRIAQEVTRAKFVFIEYRKGKYVTEVFRQRLSGAFEEFGLDYQDYCIFLPYLDGSTYAGVSAIAEVFLDSIGWSGNNTTMESTAYNIPIVTLPGDLMRGRHTLAILKMMGIEQTIATSKDEYVKIAVRLGQDSQYRQFISRKIAENKHKLYGDLKPIRALEDFLLNVVQKDVKPVAEIVANGQDAHPTRDIQLAANGQDAHPTRDIQLAANGQDAHPTRDIQLAADGQDAHPTRDIQLSAHLIEQQLDLGIAHHQAGKLTEAQACYQQVLQWQPKRADAWHLLGVIAYQQEEYLTAIEQINRAIELNSNAANFYNSLGSVYQKLRQFERALDCYQKVIQLEPNFFKAYNNIGLVYQESGKLPEAIASYQQAIQLQPNYAEAYLNLSITYDKQTQLTQAIACCQKAIQLQPNYADAYCQLGRIFSKQVKPREAVQSYQRALQIEPNYAVAHHDLMFSLLYYSCDYEPSEIYAEHRKWAERHAKLLAENIAPYDNNLTPERRLRIGYVSGDFKTHSVAYFFEPLLANRNERDFEVICYANNSTIDATTQRLRQLADGWREIYTLNDAQVAERIRQDKIDILVDLSGHTMDNRLLVFARKPAPVQVTYLGYPSTTGLDTIDYRLTDTWADPQGETEHLHTEQLVRLPHGFLCYLPASNCPDISPPPVLKSNQITFGCFNNLAKVNPELIGCWAKILQSVPNSRLIIKSKPLVDSDNCAYVHGLFQQYGIERDRVQLIGWLANQTQHLDLYNQVDIALDTFPYHGTTTTCEAMWMGVPVITQAGQTHVSRVGVSLLSSVGLETLIAASSEEYIQKAVDLANNQEQLPELRAKLRHRMQAAPLTNASLIARSLEDAYRAMWRRFCDRSLVETVNPEGSEQTISDQIQQQIELGIKYHQSGQLPAAEVCYQQVLQWQPNHADAWHLLGVIASQQGQYQTAIERINRAIELQPEAATFYSNLGNAYQEQGQFQPAIKCYQKALRLQPEFAQAKLNLRIAYKQAQLPKVLDCCVDYRTQHFEWHCQYIYEKYLKDWPPRSLPKESQYMAVIVENRAHPLLAFAIKNTLLLTPDEVGLQIFCSASNVDFVQEIVKDIENVRIVILPEVSNLENMGYSRLLKTQSFWEKIPAEKLLIFQTDTILTEPLDPRFFEYPYLGAPWLQEDIQEQFYFFHFDGDRRFPVQRDSYEITRNVSFPVKERCPVGFGNGGLSIRNRQVMLDICRRYPERSDCPEDLYFSYHVYKDLETNSGLLEVARNFVTETWFSPDSVGLHAAWKYLSSEKPAYFFEKHHKNILAYFYSNPNPIDLGIADKKQGKLPEALLNSGIAHQLKGEFELAIASYQKAIQFQPDCAVAHYNLGRVYKDRGQLTKAIQCFEQAIQLNSNYVDAHLSRGLALLLLGDFQQGLLEYEWRFKTQQFNNFKQLKVPMWDGAPLEGKSIVLGNEQGLGDAIQFVRYAPKLREQGARVILSTDPALVSLFRECLKGQFEVVESSQCNVYNYDFHVSLMSLPRIFKTSLDTIPNCTPYIFPPHPLRGCILPLSHSYRIGIVWATGKLNAQLYRQKTCTPELFIDLLNLGDISLYSLQVGEDASQIQPWLNYQRVCDLSPLLKDFVDTACAIEQLDLVITVDTAVAHLAGAMGKPVWVLLPFVPDWRWLLERQDTPWYPTMRLFRQTSPGDWASVFQQVKKRLTEVLKDASPLFPIEAKTPIN
ncbi:glycosyl transferase family 2 [Microseira wollei NIES-4236]|uniref:Probable UDP-N-acetylglucosamine--peptide N-acetylglucosaminyltransferase SPINDLY n=2 Tax=Microseira wollei TaxID=467598 RepID=A0AAV3XHB1_9CYAN|nr:glycosyl transferase family 2 [Microseira wollei NIES-4236]